MTIIPTVDQFPTFADTRLWLMEGACQCIWHLPDKKRCCLGGITDEYNKAALRLVETILQPKLLPKTKLEILADIAEKCCCARHHRNKIWGTGLKHELAIRWQNEISHTTAGSFGQSSCSVKLKSEPVEDSKVLGLDQQNEGDGWSYSENLPLSQSGCNMFAEKLVTFARHEAWKGETLHSKLMEPIKSNSSKNGSVYLYTHNTEAFSGFIKIGFTSRSTSLRLIEWEQCGHGHPDLLKSYDHVQYPERVETLIHFELAECWFELRWCKFHQKSHIEWFRIAFEIASSTVDLWSQWMKRANPYDRRGKLKSFWKETVTFLTDFDIPITAELMLQIQKIEEGSSRLPDFIADDNLGERSRSIAKQEP